MYRPIPSTHPISDYAKYAGYARALVIQRERAFFSALQVGEVSQPVYNYFSPPFELIRCYKSLDEYYEIGVLNNHADWIIDRVIEISQSSLN